jgi:hypothetical protein
MIFLPELFVLDRRPEFVIEPGDLHAFAKHDSDLLRESDGWENQRESRW